MSFEIAIQQSIYARLSTNPTILTAAVGVFDEVPQADDSGSPRVFPYIVIGDDQAIAWDTDSELGAEVTATIHTWSRYSGKKEIKELQGLVYEALHRAEFSVAGYAVVLCQFLQSQSFLDSDGKTRHGVQTFRFLIEKL